MSTRDTLNTFPAQRAVDSLILEGIVTTTNPDGSTNISPMGPVVDRSITKIRLRPFNSSTTYKNLKRNGCGVFHVTDDALLLAKAAIGQLQPTPRLVDCEAVDGKILADACRWFALRVDSLDDSSQRVEIECVVVNSDVIRPFFGWNRAMHAVLEAAILATRVQLLPAEEIMASMKPLTTMVEKTAGIAEREAFELLKQYILQHQDD